MEPNIKNLAINHIMRNIDMEISEDENFEHLYTSTHNQDLLLTLIATELRLVGDTCQAYFAEDIHVLHPLPLSLKSYIMATADNYKLVENYKIDEDEEIKITLNKKICLNFIDQILEFISENHYSYFLKLTHEHNRNCDFTFITNL